MCQGGAMFQKQAVTKEKSDLFPKIRMYNAVSKMLNFYARYAP